MSVKLECVKAKQKDLEYFETSMSFGMIDNLVRLPDDERWNHIFDDAEDAQRKLNKVRVESEMIPYLTDNKDSFFSALTLILIPRDGSVVEPNRDYKFRVADGHDKIGTIEIKDSILLFPADGQHRVAAIKGALKKDYTLAEDEIGVNLIPYHGTDEIRQLFSDLNLNAKPVSKTAGLAFEGRDPIVVISKRIMEDIKFFDGKVNEKTNSLSEKSPDVITMSTLVDSNRTLINAFVNEGILSDEQVKSIKSLRPSDVKVGEMAKSIAQVWQTVINALPAWDEVVNGTLTPGSLRKNYVSGFGLAWRAIMEVAGALIKDGDESWEDDLVHAIKAVDWAKGNHWQGIAMIGERVNNTGPGIRATAGYILYQAQLPHRGDSIQSLINTYENVIKAYQPPQVATVA